MYMYILVYVHVHHEVFFGSISTLFIEHYSLYFPPSNPQTILLDDPLSALDYKVSEQVWPACTANFALYVYIQRKP